MDHSQQHIDQLFRNKLGDYAVNPPDHIWSNIVRKRGNIALRRKLMMGLLILLLLALLVWLLLPVKPDGPAVAGGEQLPPTGMAEAISGSAIGEDDFAPDVLALTEEELDAQSRGTDNTLIQKYSGTIGLDSYKPEENQELSGYSQDIDGYFSDAQSEDVRAVSEPELAGSQSAEHAGLESEADFFNASDLPGSVGDLATLENLIENPLDSDFHPSEPGLEESSFVRKSSVALLSQEKWKANLGQRAEQEKKSALRINYCAIRNNPNCFEPAIPLRYFALDILAGPDFFSKTLDPASEEFREWADARSETESYVISYGATARVSAILQNGFALRTGVSVNQINERFRFIDPDEERRRVVNVLIDTIINAPMDTTFVFDTLSVIESGQRVRTVHNQYRMIDIPIMFGYEFNSGNWTFAPSAGLMFNVAFATSGEIISSSGHPISIPEGESGGSIFRAKLGMSVAGSFGVGYRLDSRYSVMIEPRFIYRMKPLTVSNHPIEQNYFTYGVQAGLRYRFR
jgi:hypothetical protein